jgi:hypothetical protein
MYGSLNISRIPFGQCTQVCIKGPVLSLARMIMGVQPDISKAKRNRVGSLVRHHRMACDAENDHSVNVIHIPRTLVYTKARDKVLRLSNQLLGMHFISDITEQSTSLVDLLHQSFALHAGLKVLKI